MGDKREVKLRECPFCGKPAEIDGSEALPVFWVECVALACAASGPVELTEAEAVAAWNHRVDPARQGLVEALKSALALFQKDHAISRFNWGQSCLRAEDIRELNEVPLTIRAALRDAGETI